MPSGSKPGERRGGRKKGTPHKRTQGRLRAEALAREQAATETTQSGTTSSPQQPLFDSLDQKRKIAMALISLAAEAAAKKNTKEYDPRWYKDCLQAADKAVDGLLPYEHRRLAQTSIDVEALLKRDGSLHVTISSSDADL